MWVLGDTSDDDRNAGMRTVVEYAGRNGSPQWTTPPAFTWDYRTFTHPGATTQRPDHTFDLLVDRRNAADSSFNIWPLNGVPGRSRPDGGGGVGVAIPHAERSRRRQRRFTRSPRQSHKTCIGMTLTSAVRRPHGESTRPAVHLTCHMSMLLSAKWTLPTASNRTEA